MPLDFNDAWTAIDRILVPHPSLLEAHMRLKRISDRARHASTSEGACLLIQGRSQAGKTTICKSFAASRNSEAPAEERSVPVVYISIPSRITPKGLLQDILLKIQQFGYITAATSGTESILLDRTCRSLQNLKTELLIIDECHHLKRGDREEYAADVGEMIKSIILRGACSVAMAGVGQFAEAPFIYNEQLALRAERKIVLDPLDLKNSSDRDIYFTFFIDYLLELQNAGVIDNAQALSNEKIAYALHEASEGLLGRTCRLLRLALTEMIERNDTGISLDDLIEAAETLIQHTSRSRNPFREVQG